MDKARTVKRLGRLIPDLEICVRLELSLEKGYPGKRFRKYSASNFSFPVGRISSNIFLKPSEKFIILLNFIISGLIVVTVTMLNS
jgi:hypothetical protein